MADQNTGGRDGAAGDVAPDSGDATMVRLRWHGSTEIVLLQLTRTNKFKALSGSTISALRNTQSTRRNLPCCPSYQN